MRLLVPALAAALALASPALAQDGGSLGVRLLDRDGPYLDVALAPGEQVRAAVEVSSTAAQPLDVELYAAAASGRDDGFDFADGREPNELTGWTTVTPASTSLQAGRQVRVDVVVAVPEGVPAGLRSAVVWAQVADGASGGVVQVRRVGVRVHVDVVALSVLRPAAVAAGLLVLAAAGTVVLVRRSARD